MKSKILLCLISIFIMLSIKSFSQSVIKSARLDNVSIMLQADSLKLTFQQQGFTLLKESGIEMKSQYEAPIIAALTEGTWYRIIFIGDISSKLYEVRMFDWNEKQVVYQKKMWGDVDGNIINYDYIPRFSEYHMIKPVQINKMKKNVGGYMMLFKKVIAR
jgi:hypothetical protein